MLDINRIHKKAEFYISMGNASYKRKGIAYSATKLLLAYAFGELGMNKVFLNVDAENAAACNLYEKVGFTCEGVFRQEMMHRGKMIDRKRYAMLREDYV